MADNTESNTQTNTLFNKLKKMFSSDVIVRNVGGKKLKIVDTDSVEFATDKNSLRDRYNRLRSSTYNLHNRDMSLAYQAARLELFRDYDCVGEDTIVPLPDGSRPTIKELAEKYKDTPSERFHVFSYDHSTNSVKLGNAYHPRKKTGGTRKCWKVTLDDGKYVVGSAGHPFLMRTGEYKKLEDVTVGESVMPFYQSEYGYKKHGFKRYRRVYNFCKGWQAEHKVVAEQFNGELKKNELVHHKNFNGSDNSPDNLVVMDAKVHAQFHQHHNKTVLWGDANYDVQLKKLLTNENYINRKIHHWNGERTGENNPFHGKVHTAESNEKRSKSLKEALKDIDTSGAKNPNYRDELTIEVLKVKAIEHYKQTGKLTSWGFVKDIGCDYSVLQNRLKSNKTDWKSFKREIESTLNHKIVSIEYVGEKDVYDVTVEKYQNFACDSCFLHNTMDADPILSSALDVYSEESVTPNEFGNILTITSSDENIKKILENLFNDILNIEFNLHSWARSLAKYGDFFLRMDISPEYGVYLVKPLSAYEITRVEGSDPKNINYVKFQHDGLGGGQEYENFEMAHFRLMSDSNFMPYGKCLTGNSYVETMRGAKRITDIAVGEKVWTFNVDRKVFELSDVLHKVSSGIKEIIKVSTQHNQIECSKTHPLLTFNGSELIYKTAECISVNDILVLSNNKYKITSPVKLDKTLITDHNHNGWKNNIDLLPDYVDETFAEFFGFMLGDGWLDKKLNRVAFAAGIYADLNDKYSGILSTYTGKDVKITEPRENSGGQRYVDSKVLAEFMASNGFCGNLHEKRIPAWVFELTDDLQLKFIRGLVDADGSVVTDKWNCNRYVIELNNKSLVEDIKHLLGRLNIKCSHVKCRGYDGETEIRGVKCNRTKSYYICFYLDGGVKAQQKKYDFLKNDSVILVPITKIENVEEQETFDIQVSSDNSNFVANGIIVHNSMLEPARRIWKQLSLAEDAMLIHRIVRAPEKRIFKVDVGNIPPVEVDGYIEKLMNKAKKVPYIDERTGDYNLRYNLNNMLEDFWLPVRGGDSGTSIDTLPGMEFTGIEDLEYLRNKMMAALKIPKAFLGYDEAIGGKSTLAMEDLRFARTIGRIQRIIVSELTKIAIVHLFVQGYSDASLVDFDLKLSNPSTVFEQEKIQIWQDKVNLAKDMMESNSFSRKWLYEKLWGMSDDEVASIKSEIIEDKKQEWRVEQITAEGNDPMTSNQKVGADGEMSDTGDGDMGGDLPDLGGDTGGADASGDVPDLPELTESDDPEEPTTRKEKDDRNDKRDQTGEKKNSDFARKHPFGEDHMGKSGIGVDPIIPRKCRTTLPHPVRENNRSNKITLASMSEDLKSIKKTLGQRKMIKNQKSVISETTSMLDEANLIDDAKIE